MKLKLGLKAFQYSLINHFIHHFDEVVISSVRPDGAEDNMSILKSLFKV